MQFYLATLYVSIEAASEDEAREIALHLRVLPKKQDDREKVFWDRATTEVEADDWTLKEEKRLASVAAPQTPPRPPLHGCAI